MNIFVLIALTHKGPDGVWHLGMALNPGPYEYRLFADGVWCNDPAAQQKIKNPLGTENCVRNGLNDPLSGPLAGKAPPVCSGHVRRLCGDGRGSKQQDYL